MKFSVVTFNLRCEAVVDGPNYFFNRAPYIAAKIRKENPDIICFQECTPRMQEWLRNTLFDYEVVGMGRNLKLDGESNPVAFRKDKFDLFGFDQFWLSPTPFVPGTRYEHQSRCPRICMTVCLSPKTPENFSEFIIPIWIILMPRQEFLVCSRFLIKCHRITEACVCHL